MSTRILSQEQFILSCVEEYVGCLLEQEEKKYSWRIEFGIGELVRVQMRQLAQVRAEHEAIMLERSIEITQEKLNGWFTGREFSFDFTPYFGSVRKELRFAAKEIGELSKQLSLSRRSERVAHRESITYGVTVPLEIVQVGLQNAIESILAVPLAEEFDLDLEGVREVYLVQGQWYPYQITIESLSLLLDDDGTVLMPTLGLSNTMIEQARNTLLTLVTRLYQPSLNY